MLLRREGGQWGIEQRPRSSSMSQLGKEKADGEENAFKGRGSDRSPSKKKSQLEIEGEEWACREGAKRRREPSGIEAKLDDFIEKFNRREDRAEEWEKKWEEANRRWEEANSRWEMADKRLEEEKEQRVRERKELTQQLCNVQQQLKVMEVKMDEMENRSRRANLVVKGIKEEKDESWIQSEGKVLEVFEKQLDLKGVGVVRAHRVGRQYEGRDRPIVVKFLNEKERAEILRRKSRLKNTSVFIEEDFSQRT